MPRQAVQSEGARRRKGYAGYSSQGDRETPNWRRLPCVGWKSPSPTLRLAKQWRADGPLVFAARPTTTQLWLRLPAGTARLGSARRLSYLPHGLGPGAVKAEIYQTTIEFRHRVRGSVCSRDAPVDILLLELKQSDVISCDHLTFQADHLADLDNASLAIAHAFDLHNEIECGDDLRPNGLRGQ